MARPTKYKKEYCDTAIEVQKRGFSKEAVAGHLDISKDTLYRWIKKYKEFSDAIKRGQEYCRIFWEELGIEMVTAGQGNSTAWIFNMKNRFGWKDKSETELTGKDGAPLGVVVLPEQDETRDNMGSSQRTANGSSKEN